MDLIKKYNENIDNVVEKIRNTQMDNIESAAIIIANTIKNEGIVQAIGSGHSFAGAIEIAGRAGGFIPTKAIKDFYGINGWFSSIEGVGTEYIKQMDIESADTFVIISNSGGKPLHIEFAKCVKEIGCKVIVFTNCADALNNAPKNDSVINYADVIIDNCGPTGDCSIYVDELNINVAPTSSVAVSHIATMIILRAIEILQKEGISPPIYKSVNVEGGREYNDQLLKKYKHRLNRI